MALVPDFKTSIGMTNFYSTAGTSKPVFVGCILVFSVSQNTDNFLVRKSELDLLLNEPRGHLQ